MRLIVFVPLLIFQFLFLSPIGLANNQERDFRTYQLLYKKYDFKISIPVYLVEEEVENSEDSDHENVKQNLPLVFSHYHLSFSQIYFKSLRSGLLASINSLNLRNLGLSIFQLHCNLRL
jgi:hypothetical protein